MYSDTNFRVGMISEYMTNTLIATDLIIYKCIYLEKQFKVRVARQKRWQTNRAELIYQLIFLRATN